MFRRTFYRVLLPALGLALAVCLLHIILTFCTNVGLVPAERAIPFLIDTEGGWPERLMYVNWLASVLLLLLAWRKSGSGALLGLALIFLIVLADDALQLHERLGAVFAQRLAFQPALGLRAQDFGELSVWAILGVVIAGLWCAILFGTRPESRPLAPWFLRCFGGLILAGVVMDQAHIVILQPEVLPFWRRPVDLLITLLEDGLEQVVSAFVLAYAVVALRVSQTP